MPLRPTIAYGLFAALLSNAAAIARESDTTVSPSFHPRGATPSAHAENLAFHVTEIPLPEQIAGEVDQYGLTPGGHLFIVSGRVTAIKPRSEEWDIGPSNFAAEFMTRTAYVAGHDLFYEQAGFWQPLAGPQDRYRIIEGPKSPYEALGLSDDGAILLKPLDAAANESVVYQNGTLTPFDELVLPVSATGLYPARLFPSGAIRGTYLKDGDIFHPFAIEKGKLLISDSLSLSATQAEAIIDISENGHTITRSDNSSVDLFGPEIGGIRTVNRFAAHSINNLGYAVGESTAEPAYLTPTALIWSESLGLRDLNTMTSSEHLPFVSARSIHDDLSLVALALGERQRPHLYLLTVDPSFQSAHLDVTTSLDGSRLRVLATSNFRAQEVRLQKRQDDGAWSDLDLSPTQTEANTYLFELPVPEPHALHRAAATRAQPAEPL